MNTPTAPPAMHPNAGSLPRWRLLFPLVFGLFLGLAFLKFGNPVVLDANIPAPRSATSLLHDAWPVHWADWLLLPLAAIGGLSMFAVRPRWPAGRALWTLPLLWLMWQIVAASRTADVTFTILAIAQFLGCVACYFIGVFFLNHRAALHVLLIGVLAGFALCLARAINQKFEFPLTRQMMISGQHSHWTNLPPAFVLQMRRDGAIIRTNGVEVANPVLLKKLGEGRVMGTLVYPNALAGGILLLWPLSLVLACARKLRPAIRAMALAITVALGASGLLWSGSKAGWLIALAIGGLGLLRLQWPAKLKLAAIAAAIVIGLAVFAVRFHHYFALGATSLAARFDYWRAALQITTSHPWLGCGPGSFECLYSHLKAPDWEMARLVHNDYLEQFSDSGIPGGLFYCAWVLLALAAAARRVWKKADALPFAIFIGALAWFVQGVLEFSLYVPALAWTAFTFLGALLALPVLPNSLDNEISNR